MQCVSEITTSRHAARLAVRLPYGYCGCDVSRTVRDRHQTPSIFNEKRESDRRDITRLPRHDDTPAGWEGGRVETTDVNESREGSGPHGTTARRPDDHQSRQSASLS